MRQLPKYFLLHQIIKNNVDNNDDDVDDDDVDDDDNGDDDDVCNFLALPTKYKFGQTDPVSTGQKSSILFSQFFSQYKNEIHLKVQEKFSEFRPERSHWLPTLSHVTIFFQSECYFLAKFLR